ncbi:MAG: uracil-DNA glycosylase family protein [Sphaerochaetaceae bacterium]|nr:uracil-DNA glycosylase family protein [Sphaerochaetaceae bacterium]
MFTGPKSAYVSAGYERGELPRLLFLSLDSGSAEREPDKRLPEAVRRQEEIDCAVLSLPKGLHWYRTHELAWYVLRKFKPNLLLDQAKHYFAHANSAKCCMNNKHNSKAASILFKNCRRYLAGEIAILRPAIVVTQGSEAKDAMSRLVRKISPGIDDFASIVELEWGPVFWLHTYHPRNYGAFNKQRAFNEETQLAEGFERYASAMQRFINASKFA